MTDTSMDIQKSLDDAQDSLSKYIQPSSIPIRTLALTLAQKHQSSAMPSVVVDCAVIFEQFLLGKWSTVEKDLKVTQAEVADVPEEEKTYIPFDTDDVICHIHIVSTFGSVLLGVVHNFKSQYAAHGRGWKGEFQFAPNDRIKEFLNTLDHVTKVNNKHCTLYLSLTDKDGTVNQYEYCSVQFTSDLINTIDATCILKFVASDRYETICLVDLKFQDTVIPTPEEPKAPLREIFELESKRIVAELKLHRVNYEFAVPPQEETKTPAGFTECYLDVMNPAGRIRVYSKEFECDESSRTGKFLLHQDAAGTKEFINLLNNIHKCANLPSAVHQYVTDEEGFESVYAFSILKFGKPQLQAHDTVLLEFSYRDRIKIS